MIKPVHLHRPLPYHHTQPCLLAVGSIVLLVHIKRKDKHTPSSCKHALSSVHVWHGRARRTSYAVASTAAHTKV